jgi:hypothetical protein
METDCEILVSEMGVRGIPCEEIEINRTVFVHANIIAGIKRKVRSRFRLLKVRYVVLHKQWGDPRPWILHLSPDPG